jgi:sugar lactone lactonase YvrE
MRLTLLFCLLSVGTGFAQTTVPTYTVNTFAGAAPDEDGGWAADAVLRWPQAMIFDRSGNLYVADGGNAKVRKITPGGLITTVAGTGEVGFSGDGGPASRAQISADLMGLAFDSSGNLYISDAGNNRIRKVSATDGMISTYVYGPGLPRAVPNGGFYGIALDSASNLYIAAAGKSLIFQIAPDGTFSVLGTGTSADTGDEGPATQAAFVSPQRLYKDPSDTLYVSDVGANTIRKITSDGIVHAFAGTGKAGFGGDGGPATQALLNSPTSMATDASGNFYFIDSNNYRVRQISPDGTISTVAGSAGGGSANAGDGGPATKAQFSSLNGITVSGSGDLYISGSDSAIRVVTAGDGIIRTAYGKFHFTDEGQLAETALFNLPNVANNNNNPGVLVADGQGNFYLSDDNKIRKIDRNGLLSTIAGVAATDVFGNTGDGGPATSALIGRSAAIALDPAGNVYFGSTNRVRRVDTSGNITTFAGGGASLGDGGPATQASIASVYGLAFDASGSLYIADGGNRRIRKVTPDGTMSTFAGTGTAGNSGDGGPATAAKLNILRGLAFDAAGNLYVADFGANVVRVISPDGTISTFAGTGTGGESGDGGPATAAKLQGPVNLTIDSGNVYIADVVGNTLRVVTPDGIIHTIASGPTFPNGSPVANFSASSFGGDGGPAIGASYSAILQVAFDGSGNIYLLDHANERIRVLTPNQ